MSGLDIVRWVDGMVKGNEGVFVAFPSVKGRVIGHAFEGFGVEMSVVQRLDQVGFLLRWRLVRTTAMGPWVERTGGGGSGGGDGRDERVTCRCEAGG